METTTDWLWYGRLIKEFGQTQTLQGRLIENGGINFLKMFLCWGDKTSVKHTSYRQNKIHAKFPFTQKPHFD